MLSECGPFLPARVEAPLLNGNLSNRGPSTRVPKTGALAQDDSTKGHSNPEIDLAEAEQGEAKPWAKSKGQIPSVATKLSASVDREEGETPPEQQKLGGGTRSSAPLKVGRPLYRLPGRLTSSRSRL